MTKVLKKTDMKNRIQSGADKAPTLEDRLSHAKSLAQDHPAIPNDVAAQEKSLFTAPRGGHDNLSQASNQGNNVLVSAQTATNPAQAIPLDLIDTNPYNARWLYSTERTMRLAASIAAHGQEQAGIATIRGGRYILAAGHYRLRALKHLSSKTMDLVVKPDMTDKELYQASFRENDEHEPQTVMDNAIAWNNLLEASVYSSTTELATAIGQSQGYVSKVLKALKLHEGVREVIALKPDAFGATVLYELSLYDAAAGHAKAETAARMIIEGTLSRKGLEDMRASIETPKVRKQKEMARQYKLQGTDGAEYGSIKEWDSGRVMLDVTLPESDRRNDLMRVLREQFGITA